MVVQLRQSTQPVAAHSASRIVASSVASAPCGGQPASRPVGPVTGARCLIGSRMSTFVPSTRKSAAVQKGCMLFFGDTALAAQVKTLQVEVGDIV